MAARAGGNASSAMTRREGGPVPRGGGGQGAAQQDRYQPGPLPPGGPPGLAGGVPQQAAQGGRGTAPGLRLLLGQQCVRPHHGRAMAELADGGQAEVKGGGNLCPSHYLIEQRSVFRVILSKDSSPSHCVTLGFRNPDIQNERRRPNVNNK